MQKKIVAKRNMNEKIMKTSTMTKIKMVKLTMSK